MDEVLWMKVPDFALGINNELLCIRWNIYFHLQKIGIKHVIGFANGLFTLE